MWALVVLYILAGLMALCIFLLSVPVDLRLSFETGGGAKFRMKLVWFFGLLKKEIKRSKKSEAFKKEEPEKKRQRRRKAPDLSMIFEMLRVKGLFSQVKKFLKDVIKLPGVREIEADFTVGLDDPADTGMLFAFLGPAAVFAGQAIPGRIEVRPSFEDDLMLDGYLRGTVRVQPIRAIPPVLKLIFSKPVFSILKILVVKKWKRRKK